MRIAVFLLLSFAFNGMHVVAYAGLASAWIFALASRESLGDAAQGRRHAARALVLATGYGLVDEVHQYFVPGRTASLGDLVSDCCGALLSGVLARALLYDDRGALRYLPWLVVAFCGSIALATFAPI